MKVKYILFGLVFSFFLVSCGEGKVDADAEVVVQGRIMLGPDTPYSNQMVFLHRSSTLWESFTDELFFAWYWLDCFFSEIENDGSCGAWQMTQSDADGWYSFTFTGADTTNEIDRLLDFQVSAVRGIGFDNEITLMTFQVERETLSFPDLYFWNEPPPADFTSTNMVLDWEGEPVYGSQAAELTDVVFVQGHWEVFADFMDGFPVWEVTSIEGQLLELDARIFQDQVVSFRASDQIAQNQFSTEVQVRRTSPTGFLEQQSHVPLSRGAACIYTTNLGTRTEQPDRGGCLRGCDPRNPAFLHRRGPQRWLCAADRGASDLRGERGANRRRRHRAGRPGDHHRDPAGFLSLLPVISTEPGPGCSGRGRGDRPSGSKR